MTPVLESNILEEDRKLTLRHRPEDENERRVSNSLAFKSPHASIKDPAIRASPASFPAYSRRLWRRQPG
jgi:hypothetical protein